MKKLFYYLSIVLIAIGLNGCWLFGDLDSTMPLTEFYFNSYEELKSHLNSNNIKFPETDLTEEQIEAQGRLPLFHHYLLVDLLGASERIIDSCYELSTYENKASINDITGAPYLSFFYKVESDNGLLEIVILIKPCSEAKTLSIEPAEWKYYPGGKETRRGFYYPFKPSEEYPPKQFIHDIYMQESTFLDRGYGILNMEIRFLYEWGYKINSVDKQFEETIFNYVYQNLEVVKIE